MIRANPEERYCLVRVPNDAGADNAFWVVDEL